MVTSCTTRFNIQNTHFLPTQYITCFVWILEQTAFFTLYSVNWLVFIQPIRSVFTAWYELKSRLTLYFIRVKGYCHKYKYRNCLLPSNCIRRSGIPVFKIVDKKGKKGKVTNFRTIYQRSSPALYYQDITSEDTAK